MGIREGSKPESDGETAIRAILERSHIKFEQEKEIHNLRGDTKRFRTADFYLPEHDVYIEFLGGWDKRDPEEQEGERRRYGHKRHVYQDNGIKCIWIYPRQLHYAKNVITDGLKKFENITEPVPSNEKSRDQLKSNTFMIIALLVSIYVILLIIGSSLSVLFGTNARRTVASTGEQARASINEAMQKCTSRCDEVRDKALELNPSPNDYLLEVIASCYSDCNSMRDAMWKEAFG